MIMFAAKISLKKVLIGLAALGAVVWGVTTLSPRVSETVSAMSGEVSQKLKTNEERLSYLQSFGWEAETEPVVEMEVQIPKQFDAAYEAYNALQKRQGLDLSKYRGKRAMLYTYRLSAHPSGEEGVTVSLVFYKNRIIAADVSSQEAEGFTHGINEGLEQGE